MTALHHPAPRFFALLFFGFFFCARADVRAQAKLIRNPVGFGAVKAFVQTQVLSFVAAVSCGSAQPTRSAHFQACGDVLKCGLQQR